MSSSLSKHPKIAAEIQLDPDPDPPPHKSTPSPSFLWSSLFADSASDNTPSSSPSYLPDGTPVVIAPPSVILRASSTWAGHLLCRFLGEPPSPAKFFSDLNRVWGKHGDISVRRFSSGIFLVHVPSPSTRKWILQTGLWSSGTVSFVVSEWSVNSTFASPPKLTSATTVITIREIPPQLWSHEAVARIVGGVSKLIPGTRASLPLSSLGTATIRAIVPLGSPLPPSVLVKDSNGDSVLVSIDYGRLPHLCSLCNSYGHQLHRCPLRQSATKPIPPKSNSMSQEENMTAERVIDSLNLPLVKSSSNTPDPAVQNMDLDNIVCEGMVLNCSSDPHLDSASSLKSDVSHQVSSSSSLVSSELMQSEALVIECVTTSLNPSLIKSSLQDPEVIVQNMDLEQVTPLSPKFGPSLMQVPSTQPSASSEPQPHCDITSLNSSLVKPSLQSSEIVDQVMDLESEAVQERLSNGTTNSHSVPVSSSIPTDILQQVTSSPSSPQACPELMQPIIYTKSSESLDVSTNVESLDMITDVSCKEHSSNQISNPDPTPITFSFPPPATQALELEKDHIPLSSSHDIPPLNQHSKEPTKTDSKKVRYGNKTQEKLATDYLRCKRVSSQFKPKGVVEKRRKKVQDKLLPEAEELQHGIMELKSDKKNTTYYETLLAYKISGNSQSVTEETLET